MVCHHHSSCESPQIYFGLIEGGISFGETSAFLSAMRRILVRSRVYLFVLFVVGSVLVEHTCLTPQS